MEIFSNIESQMQRAVQLGEDKVVQALDKEIDPLLENILVYRATTTSELHKQLKFITDLLVRRCDDAAAVVRLSAKLSELLARYFQDGQLNLREPQGLSDFAIRPLVEPRVETPREPLAVARVAVISMDYRFLYCNSVMSADLKFAPRQLVGRPISEFCNMPIFEDAYRPHVDMCLAGNFREFDAPSLAGRGDAEGYHVRLTPLRNIERRITGAVLVAQSELHRGAEVAGH